MLAPQLVLPRTGTAVCLLCCVITLFSACRRNDNELSKSLACAETSPSTIIPGNAASRGAIFDIDAACVEDDGDIRRPMPGFQVVSINSPRMAKADVNGDGLIDIFICGSKGRPRAMYITQKGGVLLLSNTRAFNDNTTYKDADCVFFDADGDNDADLFICRDYDVLRPGQLQVFDCLYINDGRGNFALSRQVLPAASAVEKHTCVSAADFDADGDIDLYIGVHAGEEQFGHYPGGYLLQNDGYGVFTNITGQACPLLNRLAMITDARWFDYDKDGRPDLILASEGMPVKIFHNAWGRLAEENINSPQNSSGCWNRFVLADMNNDGYEDIIAGHDDITNICKNDAPNTFMHYTTNVNNNTLLAATICTYKVSSIDGLAFAESTSQVSYIQSGVLINNKKRGFVLQSLPVERQFTLVDGTAFKDFYDTGRGRITPAHSFY